MKEEMNLYDYLDPDNYKTWSNVTGYGNITMDFVKKNNINQTNIPWNRIPALSKPTSTSIMPNNTWSPSTGAPVNNSRIQNLLNKNCNLCKDNENIC